MTEKITKPERNISLDIFRGMTVCFMIIVNTSGNGATTYWCLKHADWNGFTPTDLVFPSFLFAVGTSMSFVMRSWSKMTRNQVLYKILKRTFLIFLIGFLMYWFPFFKLDGQSHVVAFPISETRIMGVLQRIALCYGIVSLMIYFLGTKKTIWAGIAALPIYWAILWFFGADGEQYSKLGNVVLALDTKVLGLNHIYTGEGFPFDPEGILSTIPALFNTVMGFAVGLYLQKNGKQIKPLGYMILAAAAMIILAVIWNQWMPINKKLWTSSYALLTVGLDMILIAIITCIVDILNFKWGTNFFLVTGKNPLFIYLMSELGVVVLWMTRIGKEPTFSWLYNHIFVRAGEYFGAFLFSVWWMLTCWLVGYILDKKKIYIKL